MQKSLLGVALTALVAAGYSGTVAAKEQPEWRSYAHGQRLTGSISAFRPKLNTRISVSDPESVIQGQIDFERDIGLDDSKSTGNLGVKWRISRRNKLRFDYFKLDRSGAGATQVQITIDPGDGGPNISFPIDAPVQGFVDIEAYNFGYEFAPIFNEKWDWSVGLGLSWQDIAIGVTDPTQPDRVAQTDVAAPLPTLSTSLTYVINDKWLLDLGLGWLDLELDLDNSGKFEGRILALDAGVRWQTWENVGFSAGFRSFDVEADVEDTDIKGSVDYDYNGPFFGINAYF